MSLYLCKSKYYVLFLPTNYKVLSVNQLKKKLKHEDYRYKFDPCADTTKTIQRQSLTVCLRALVRQGLAFVKNEGRQMKFEIMAKEALLKSFLVPECCHFIRE